MIRTEHEGIIAGKALAVLEAESLLDQARYVMSEPLEKISVTELRHMKTHMDLLNSKGAIQLQIHNKPAAVLVSTNHYEMMIAITNRLDEITKRLLRDDIQQAGSDFDAMFQQYTSKASRDAADSLFSASGEDLASSFEPGKTEKK
tara:strand:+ start:198 stop:635 length:438 start_codon:yes stop_codon:yes gene_type:complete